MKKFLVGMLVTVMTVSLTIVPVMAEEIVIVETEAASVTEYTSGNYKYTINADGRTATITQYLGSETDIVIPSEIDGYTVTVLGQDSFRDVDANSVTIPDSVTVLGKACFYSSRIWDIKMSKNTAKICYEAFFSCGSNNIVIPATVTTIEEGAFFGNKFEIEAGNTAYKKIGDCLFSMDGKTLIAYSWNDTSGEYVVPDTVTRIGTYGLAWANYDKIVISDSVIEIGEGALHSTGASEIVIGKGVTSIGEYAFWDIRCKSITIPGNVKTIGKSAFNGSYVENIILGEGIETIEASAFSNCDNIKSIVLPASLKSIAPTALTYIPNLENITVAEGGQNFKAIDNVLYSYDGTEFVAYPNKKTDVEYVIPEGVITIQQSAFWNNEYIKRIKLANTVEVVGERAFSHCTNLEAVVFPGNVKRIEDYTFYGCDSLNGVLLPSSIEFVGMWGFGNCEALTDVYYVGSQEDWSNVKISYYNDVLDVTNIHFLGNLKDFVDRMYTVALGRDFDEVGLNGWVQMLIEETHDGAGLAKEFVLGPEFALRNLTDEQYVDVLYATFFNREADAAGKELWIATLATGATREYVLSQFVNLAEFTMLCAEYDINRGVMFPDGSVAAPGLPQFVSRLYLEVLGRGAESEGLYNWTAALATKAVTAEAAAVNFFTSQEYDLKNVDSSTFVTDCYSVFMDREADEEGLAYWVSCLEEYGVSREWVISEFAKSDEFKAIAAKYGL